MMKKYNVFNDDDRFLIQRELWQDKIQKKKIICIIIGLKKRKCEKNIIDN